VRGIWGSLLHRPTWLISRPLRSGIRAISGIGILLSSFDSPRLPVDISLFDVASLEAVELYQGNAEVPFEFGGIANDRGVLVLWMRPAAQDGPLSQPAMLVAARSAARLTGSSPRWA
jgi:hypothetical protein